MEMLSVVNNIGLNIAGKPATEWYARRSSETFTKTKLPNKWSDESELEELTLQPNGIKVEGEEGILPVP